VELVLVRDVRVVADGVEGAVDGVAQLVDLLPGAPVVRAVGSADVDAHLGAVVVHPHPGRGAARAGGGEAAVAVDAVRARLGRVVEACVEAAGEPQTLPAAEVPVVRLGDLEGALRPDVDRDVQPVDDVCARRGGGGGQQEQRGEGQHEGGEGAGQSAHARQRYRER